MPNYQRKLRNYLQRPRFQLRYAWYFFIFGVCSACCVQWVTYNKIRNAVVDEYLKQGSEKGLLGAIDPAVIIIGPELFLFVLFYGTICLLFGIYITHKVVGPIVALKRHVKEIKAGNLDSMVYFRSGDDLKEVADLINDLSDHLRKK